MTNRSSIDLQSAPGAEDARVKFAISLCAGVLSVALLGFGARKLLHLDAVDTAAKPAAPTAPADTPHPVDFVVQSPIPDALMVFRGNTQSMPVNTEVPNSDTPELIEVTAPGHEGRRFWIKLDRPRSLVVALPMGSGVVDATYEETVIALGDALVKPENGGLAMNNPRPQGGSGPRWTPPPRATQAEPKATAAAPQPPVAAPPVVVAAPQPTVAVVAPPVAAPPIVAAPSVPPGTVDPKGVRATVKAHSAQVSSCYERARMEKPDLAGRVVVGAAIGPGGEVTSASVNSSTAQNARFETCLLSAFRSWTFPPPAGGVPGNVAYTFVFD